MIVTAGLGGNRENSGRKEWNLGEANKLITLLTILVTPLRNAIVLQVEGPGLES